MPIHELEDSHSGLRVPDKSGRFQKGDLAFWERRLMSSKDLDGCEFFAGIGGIHQAFSRGLKESKTSL